MASLELPPDRTAPARARRFVADTMLRWDCDDATADVALLVSELVTNGVLHARSHLRVTMERAGSTVRVSVHDESRTRPRPRPYAPEAVTGRGLLLVERIASRWGVVDETDGKSVWFELDTPRRDAPVRADGDRAQPR